MSKSFPISKITVPGGRQREELGDLSDLKASLSSIGLINPVVLDETDCLIAGERRLTAAQELGWTHIPINYMSDLSPLHREQVELDENIKRKDLTWQEEANATARYHNLCKELAEAQGDDWSIEDTADYLSVGTTAIKQRIRLAKAIQDGDERVLDAPKASTAFGILERSDQRKADAEMEKLSVAMAKPQVSEDDEVVEADDPTPEPVDFDTPIICADFVDWSPSKSADKFNFIHCDFPYGIDADKHDQGASDSFGGYGDSFATYERLIERLRFAIDEGTVAQSAHLMFWFSMNHYTYTKHALEDMGWRVNPHPLIWHKIDNSGILPDPKRGGRQIYETAFMASRGDRFIVRPKSNAIGYPNKKEIHMSEKPRAMLQHFMEMFVDETTLMLDPTAGSGNSIIACERLGGKALGLEINPEFHELAVTNYRKEQEDA